MKFKRLKSRIAQTLIVMMLVTSTGISSLAQAVADTGSLDGFLGEDYKLVTLHTDQGEFLHPLRHSASDVQSPANASRSNAARAAAEDDDEEFLEDVDLINDLGGTGARTGNAKTIVSLLDGTDKKATTFAVVEEDGYAYLTKDMIRQVIGEPGTESENLVYGEWDGGGLKKALVYWLAEEGKPETEVNLEGENGEGYRLTEDITHLYAYSFIRGHVDATDLMDEDGMCRVGALDLPENVKLRVVDLEEEYKKSPADLQEALKAAPAGTVYENLDPDSILQMNIHTTSRDYTGGATIKMELPEWFCQKKEEENKEFVVIHYKNWETPEVIEPEIFRYDGEETHGIAGIQFTLTSFSPVIVALADKTSMVEVTLENVKNGYGAVYSDERDEQGHVTTRTYLPIGETVQVPAGTMFSTNSTYLWTEETEYDVFSYRIKVDDGTPGTIEAPEDYTIPEDAKKVVITPVPEVYEPDEPGESEDAWINCRIDSPWIGTRKESGRFRLRSHTDGGTVTLNAVNWKFGDISQLEEWEQREIKNDLFTLEEDGTFTSKDVLQPGRYRFYVTCEYEGEIYENRHLTVYAGANVDFRIYLGYTALEEDSIASDYFADSDYYLPGTTFGKIRSDTLEQGDASWWIPQTVAMYGHEFAGWYTGDKATVELKDDTKIEERTDAYARFRKLGSTEFYNPFIALDGATDPVNPDNPVNPNRPSYSGGGGGGSSSSSSSTAADTISGSWQRDDRGWRFQLSGGSYATNQWGRLKGVWYYFGADTYMVTGWLNLNGLWYYLNPAQGDQEGQMKTGWIFDQAYGRWFYLNPAQGSQEGLMLTGWRQINNVWYYLNPAADGTGGAMLADQWVGDYYVNADGAWVPGMTR